MEVNWKTGLADYNNHQFASDDASDDDNPVTIGVSYFALVTAGIAYVHEIATSSVFLIVTQTPNSGFKPSVGGAFKPTS